ncbi:unnamed protein product [Prorocentrum cordatum]|uniref:ISXO2-like transposase domain-containing protein n=1 Tax=Prorocentrum cordatum TaxID=2364126 RepID=A0ABN9TRM7_9DINO|nr:unnamed protein product [Polarella glacialis]
MLTLELGVAFVITHVQVNDILTIVQVNILTVVFVLPHVQVNILTVVFVLPHVQESPCLREHRSPRFLAAALPERLSTAACSATESTRRRAPSGMASADRLFKPWPGLQQDIDLDGPFETHLWNCAHCNCKLVARTGMASRPGATCILRDLHGTEEISVRQWRCQGRNCMLTYGAKFAWIDGQKVNTASLNDFEKIGVVFVSTKRAFTLRYLRYHEKAMFRMCTSATGTDWVMQETFADKSQRAYGGEFLHDYRKLHLEGILYLLAVQVMEPVGKHLNIVLGEEISAAALKKFDAYLHDCVFPDPRPNKVSLLIEDGHEKVAMKCPEPVAGRPSAVTKRPAAMKRRSMKRSVDKKPPAMKATMHRNYGWYMVVTPQGRVVTAIEQAVPEGNGVAAAALGRAIVNHPKVDTYAYDRCCSFYQSAMKIVALKPIKYWTVDWMHAKRHSDTCPCNPYHILRLKLRLKGVNTQAAEQTFSWFKGYSRILNEMSPLRHQFMVLYFCKLLNQYIAERRADYLPPMAAVVSSGMRVGHYGC